MRTRGSQVHQCRKRDNGPSGVPDYVAPVHLSANALVFLPCASREAWTNEESVCEDVRRCGGGLSKDVEPCSFCRCQVSERAARIVTVVNPHVLVPQGVRRHGDRGECKQDAAIDYVEYLAFAVIRGTIGDAIYRGEECENIQSCRSLVCKMRILWFSKVVSPNRIPENMVPTYMDLSNGMLIGVVQAMPESAISIKPQISGARIGEPVKRE